MEMDQENRAWGSAGLSWRKQPDLRDPDPDNGLEDEWTRCLFRLLKFCPPSSIVIPCQLTVDLFMFVASNDKMERELHEILKRS